MTEEYIQLLSTLIATPSVSRAEEATAGLLEAWLRQRGVPTRRIANNIVARGSVWDAVKPTLMLNAHHDTVKPNPGYTRNPFQPTVEDGRLYGLGSNDDGGSVIALIATFLRLKDSELPFNLLLAISAEEECSGANGMRLLLQHIGPVDMAIVGEPTGMKCAVGERGLMVLDCTAYGRSGHAARGDGENALYKALDDIARLRSLHFPRKSALMGDIGINVTQIQAGTQHNVIPAECRFVVDVRTTDAYTNEETLAIISAAVKSEVKARSTHLHASYISVGHPLVKAVDRLGIEKFLSPTMSDMTLMPFPTIKIGPGDSRRSHSADEYILIDEIDRATETYIKLIHAI